MLVSETAAPPPDFVTRLWFAWACFFRVLLDGAFAGRAWAVRDRLPELPSAQPSPTSPPLAEGPTDEELEEAREAAQAEGRTEGRAQGALTLLSLLQSEGRFVDFIKQDITAFDDQDVGTAARVVHDGCRRALKDRVELSPILDQKEGAAVTLDKDADRQAIKLTGDVPGKAAAVKGTLKHHGWRAKGLKLPEPTKGHAHDIVFPAEVEL